MFLTPIEILKGTLHSIKCEARHGSDGLYHQSETLYVQEGLQAERPELGSHHSVGFWHVSSVLQVLVYEAGSRWDLVLVA